MEINLNDNDQQNAYDLGFTEAFAPNGVDVAAPDYEDGRLTAAWQQGHAAGKMHMDDTPPSSKLPPLKSPEEVAGCRYGDGGGQPKFFGFLAYVAASVIIFGIIAALCS